MELVGDVVGLGAGLVLALALGLGGGVGVAVVVLEDHLAAVRLVGLVEVVSHHQAAGVAHRRVSCTGGRGELLDRLAVGVAGILPADEGDLAVGAPAVGGAAVPARVGGHAGQRVGGVRQLVHTRR